MKRATATPTTLIAAVLSVACLSGCCGACATATISNCPSDVQYWCLAAENHNRLYPMRTCVGANWPMCSQMNPWHCVVNYDHPPVASSGHGTWASDVEWKDGDRLALIIRSEHKGWTAWWWSSDDVNTQRGLPYFYTTTAAFDLDRASVSPLSAEQMADVHAAEVDARIGPVVTE